MDRALKERVVGATVLVVIAVLVVPVFLDGPPAETEMITESVTLPGQREQSTKRQTIVLERDREQPVPVPGSSGGTEREPRPAPSRDDAQPAAAAEVPKEQPKPPPATAGAQDRTAERQAPAKRPAADDDAAVTAAASAGNESATGMWAVQLGSFSNQANAEKLAADLRGQGYAAFLSRVQTASAVLHRVRVGPQQNRESAEKVAAELSGDGHKGQVVPHP